ncbi:MAG: amylo-alpha-1,6-glucosidase, partial [Microbacteriaceae bacterium]|nr:amylo-alpha-1,6-glucosidase [Microbacteriaceae bacterium]
MSATRTGAPMLSDRVGLVAAPTQLWADADGSTRARGINGLYNGDWRILSGIDIQVVDAPLETIWMHRDTDRLTMVAHCATLDDASKDPRVLVESELRVTPGSLSIAVTASNATDRSITAVIRVALDVSLEPIDLLRAGMSAPEPYRLAHLAQSIAISVDDRSVVVSADDARLVHDDSRVIAEWALELEPGRSARHELAIAMEDATLALAGGGMTPWREHPLSGDRRLDRWIATAQADLRGLTLVRSEHPDEPFVAAGAPWYLTLFGRDSLTTARMMLPLGTDLALGTLRALARMQGTRVDAVTGEQPGKILHEYRSAPIRIPRDGVVLPPVYFGTIDATLLWVSLLHATWRAGAPELEIRSLLPALLRALTWMRDTADSDGDGFVEYLDPAGSGLANQGWKDSADAVRHADGAAAVGPIALCEVQGHYCRAALDAAELLGAFGEPGEGEWR